jgi:hypothetical protein
MEAATSGADRQRRKYKRVGRGGKEANCLRVMAFVKEKSGIEAKGVTEQRRFMRRIS